MLKTRREPRHLPTKKDNTHRMKPESDKEKEKENSDPLPERKDESGFRRMHKNACRTKVCEFLEYRSQRINRLRHPSLWLISKSYLKKLEQVGPVQPEEEERPEKARKISWSEEAEYVYFNTRKSSASISSSERHTFALEE